MTYNHVSDKNMFTSFQNHIYILFKHIEAITNSTNMMFKENNGNTIIMKCYVNYEFQYDV